MQQSIVVSVRLDERLVRALDGAAAGRERSDVIREALEEWVRRRTLAEMVREHEAAYQRSPVQSGELDWLLEASVWPDAQGTRMVPVVSNVSKPRASARPKAPKKRPRRG